MSKIEVLQRIQTRYPGEDGRELYNIFAALIDASAAEAASVRADVNAYTTTLAAKLNADAGVTDVNYAASAL